PLTLLQIITDSQYVMDGLTSHLAHWEDQGWIGIENKALWKAVAYHARKCAAETLFRWVKGHSNDEGNKQADHLAQLGALQCITDVIDLDIPAEFNTQGAKLQMITQASAYKGIKE
ncbi:hypothetical protein DFH29DRAFT_792098, partial [Suillus ampliporus]